MSENQGIARGLYRRFPYGSVVATINDCVILGKGKPFHVSAVRSGSNAITHKERSMIAENRSFPPSDFAIAFSVPSNTAGSRLKQQEVATMTVAPKPHDVRRLVIQTLEELGADVPTLFDLEETILVDDGECTARSYRIEGYMAMWLVPVGIVQFYDAEGNMLATANLFKELEPLKMAA